MAPSSAPPVLDRPRTAPAEAVEIGGSAPPVTAAPPVGRAPLDGPAPLDSPAPLDRPEPSDSLAAPDSPAPPVDPTPPDTPASSADPAPPAPRRTRRLPHPPGRRAPSWLTALVAGAVLAAVSSVLGTAPQAVPVDASDYGLASDLGLTDGLDDTDVRRGITEAEAQARLGELAASRAAREPETVLPTQGRLTTCFCMRWGQMHYGLDLAAPLGTPIHSAADGVVIRAGHASGFGNAVYIQDADGNVHVYGHMRYYDVEAGDLVHAGDEIAQVGNEGYSTGPHLHYEIHGGGVGGRRIDPQEWLAERGVGI